MLLIDVSFIENVRNTCFFIGSLVAADRYGCFLLAARAAERAGVRHAVCVDLSVWCSIKSTDTRLHFQACLV